MHLSPKEIFVISGFGAILLLIGLILVVDAVRRAVSEGREKNHDLHV